MIHPASAPAGLRLPVSRSARVTSALFALASALAASAALAQGTLPLWPSQYRVRAWETDKLTAADVVGPDGIVYPDFTRAGVTGGIPDINNSTVRSGYTVYSVTSYGANGSDTALDDTAVANAVAAANANAASGGKSILYFPAGTYHLSQTRTVTSSRVVIDGDGPSSTKIKLQAGGFTRPGSTPTLTPIAAFNFLPSAIWGGDHLAIVSSLPRGGDTATFSVNPAAYYAVGDWIRIVATNATAGTTMRERYSNGAKFATYSDPFQHFGRLFFAKITAINSTAKTVTFDRTFVHDYAADEVPQMRKGFMLEGCGVQDLEIETLDATVQLDPLYFVQCVESWMKNVSISNARNWSYLVDSLARFEVRDCAFFGTWAPLNSGSNSYLGHTSHADSLMINCTGGDLRHMAIFQYSTRSVVSGCSFGGVNTQSPQLHGRFPVDNLVEDTTFNSTGGVSAFGVDAACSLVHGPNGPRNVLYNNRMLQGGGFEIMGTQENLILVYNRVLRTSDSHRPAPILGSDRVFDTIVRGNVFQGTYAQAFLNLEDLTCPGWEVTDNKIYGSNGHLWAGDSTPALAHNNRFYPLATTPASTTPPVPSLFAWQKQNANTPRLVLVIDRRSVADNGAITAARVVRVKSPLASALTVNLSATPAGLSFPASVTIPAGLSSIGFTLTGVNVTNEQNVVLTATASGLLADTETVAVLDQGVAQPDFGLGKVTPSIAGLPANWRTRDYGRALTAGSTTYNSTTGTWTLTGSGPETTIDDGILGRTGRRVAYQSVDGDGEIRARITSVSGDKQAGLLVMDDESASSDFIWVTPDGRVLSSGYRTDSHAKPTQYAAAGTKTVPSWLRLKRVGAVFTAYRSTVASPASESDWTILATVDFYQDNTKPGETSYKSQSVLDQRMHYGLVVNSGSETTLATATFTNVSVTGTVVPVTAAGSKLVIASSSATATQTGNTPQNSHDGSLSTRWAGDGYGQSITYDLGSAKWIGSVKLAWFNGNARQYAFDLEFSTDNTNWTALLTNVLSSGSTTALETHAFSPRFARYVRVTGRGNSSNFPTWTSLAETEIWAP